MRQGRIWAAASLALVITIGQAAAEQEVGADANGSQLEEIVITAQKRTQNLQEVPISVQVVGSLELQQENLTSLVDLTKDVPSLRIQVAGRVNSTFIRGIGSGPSQVFDQSVATFSDDIYHGRSRMSSAAFLDLDRVEVLKGPQSTFFGNNAIAGAVNIVTKQPTDQFDAWARGLYGMFGQYVAEGAVGGPVTDTISARAAISVNGEDGWLKNLNTGRENPDQNNIAGRLSFRVHPNEDFDATLKVEGSRNRDESGLFTQMVNCPPTVGTPAGFCAAALAQGVPIGFGSRTSDENGGLHHLDTFEDTLTVNFRHWDHTFTSVSGYYNYHDQFNFDVDDTPANLLHAYVPEHYHQFSQEFRVASPTNQPIEYLGGVYYQTDHLDFATDYSYFFLSPTVQKLAPFAPLVPYLPLGQETAMQQQEDSYSAFVAATWNATDRLKFNAGLRESDVHKSFTSHLSYATATETFGGFVLLPPNVAPLAGALGIGVPSNFAGARTDRALMPSAGVQFLITSDVMAYASFAKGFKAGGFNGADSTGVYANVPFGPEHVKSYEVGLKSEWLDHRILVNADLFRGDYSDLQTAVSAIQAKGNVISVVKNAADARAQGVEFEGQLLVTDAFHLSSAVTYLDGHQTPIPLPNVVSATTQNLIPKWSGDVSATYTLTLPRQYRFISEIGAYYTSDQGVNNVGNLGSGAFTRIDGRLSLETPGRHWAFDLIGKNLADRNILIITSALPVSGAAAIAQRDNPRNVSIQARYRW